ncbi:MAG: hypothetical protein KVP17_000478 [Porospora cf. gigantea B]|uniref:uncharacterized protein n=1 Tax=Porospora cf. gigantea B TaxID=2853592 RepID=UPI003571E615|nr:MAG: hypothetical protein KVP17_000478 [Porospora cf. gigantea B]
MVDFMVEEMHSSGTMLYVNGNRFEGEFRDDKENGQGTLTTIQGDLTEGMFKNGLVEGQAAAQFGNGESYKAGGRASQKHGQGVKLTRHQLNRELKSPVLSQMHGWRNLQDDN